MATPKKRKQVRKKLPVIRRNHELRMSFDPHTIEHLGIKMYSNLSNAVAELVANAYDADAKTVAIKLFDSPKNKRIEIIDNGIGMDFEEINQKFLRIGRKRRDEGLVYSPSGKRRATGKKGLGKLAFFGIGNTIKVVTTKRRSGKKITFTLNWDSILSIKNGDYKPEFSIEKCSKTLKGTHIILSNLKRKAGFDKADLAESISRLFNLLNAEFKVYVTLNNDKRLLVDNKMKYNKIEPQFQWKFPTFVKEVNSSYEEKRKIKGVIISTEKPLKPGLRGISLFANGRLVNAPEFFGVSESSHAFSYFTGWLDVDFVDEWPEDVISTDRQSLNWDLTKTIELREFLKKMMFELERKWREKRIENRRKSIRQKAKIDITSWFNNLPDNILSNMEPIVNKIIEDSELSEDEQSDVLKKLNTIVPAYPYFHWRNINPSLQNVSEKYYQSKDYYTAFIEALKRYVLEVRKRSNSTNSSDRSMMGEVFSGRKLSVTKKFKRRDGSAFAADTIKNIEEGQQYLSEGIVTGGRNPLQHEEHIELSTTGLFSEKDCLDFLSLLSHLYKRLNESENS